MNYLFCRCWLCVTYSVHMLLHQDWRQSWCFLLGCNSIASQRQLSWCICYRHGEMFPFHCVKMVKGDTLWCKPTPLMTLPAMYADLQCRVCEVVEHPSVCLSLPSFDSRTGLWWVWCWAPHGQENDCCTVSLQQACYADGALCSAAAMPQHSTQACVERRQLDSHVDCRVDETQHRLVTYQELWAPRFIYHFLQTLGKIKLEICTIKTIFFYDKRMLLWSFHTVTFVLMYSYKWWSDKL